ncbi:MAG: hypothetical protein GY820_22775 [Gammaproteobacteria bacterium]|nr:hypothetical protein [Gammaproteobacteria bacterium]
MTTTAPRVTMIPKYCDRTEAELCYCNTAAISRPSKPVVVPADPGNNSTSTMAVLHREGGQMANVENHL